MWGLGFSSRLSWIGGPCCLGIDELVWCQVQPEPIKEERVLLISKVMGHSVYKYNPMKVFWRVILISRFYLCRLHWTSQRGSAGHRPVFSEQAAKSEQQESKGASDRFRRLRRACPPPGPPVPPEVLLTSHQPIQDSQFGQGLICVSESVFCSNLCAFLIQIIIFPPSWNFFNWHMEGLLYLLVSDTQHSDSVIHTCVLIHTYSCSDYFLW